MSQEVVQGAEFRLVRDGEAGHYYLQVGVEGAWRTFAGMKLGKFDHLREQARARQSEQTNQQQA